MKSTFQRGRSTFKCQCCGRLTREVDNGGGNLCQQCWDIAGWDNHFNDNGTMPAAADQLMLADLLRQIGSKGGDVAKVKDFNEYAFPAEGQSNAHEDRPGFVDVETGKPITAAPVVKSTKKGLTMNMTTQTLPRFIATLTEDEVLCHPHTLRTKIFRAVIKAGDKGITIPELAAKTKIAVPRVKGALYKLALMFRVATK